MSPFAIGDVVRLNSGGPNMLVVRCDDDGVTCVWAAMRGPVLEQLGAELRYTNSDTFPSDALKLIADAWKGGEL